jgi:predicted DNA-binding transcriptional regulator YafY
MMTASKGHGEVAPDLRWSVERRLAFIDFRLWWEGKINRSDIEERFGVSTNQASADLNRYMAMRPDNMVYDKRKKRYLITDKFRAAIAQPDSADYLSELRLIAEGVLEANVARVDAIPPFDVVVTPARPVKPDVLRAVLQAIRERKALVITYQSFSSPTPTKRTIEPHALAHDGFRWHARSWCAKDKDWKDFVLGRMTAPEVAGASTQNPLGDSDWHELEDITIRPHPKLSDGQRAAIEADYGMTDGKLTAEVRRALKFYVLRRLGLDVKPDLRAPTEQHIVLDGPAGTNNQGQVA